MSATENDSLAAALYELEEARGLLENPNPTLKQIQTARDSAKKAAKLLSAGLTLMEEGVYRVAPEPMAGTPLPGMEGHR